MKKLAGKLTTQLPVRDLQSWKRASPGQIRRTSRHLFNHWAEVANRFRTARRIVLFLDFDGTLTPLRRRPEDVKPLSPVMQRLLLQLARHPRLTLYVISGRALDDLRNLVPTRGARLLGLHGWEGRRAPNLSAERKLLLKALQLLKENLPASTRVWVQDKGLGLSVHFREASPKAVRLATPVVQRVSGLFHPHLRLLEGKKIWELLPRAINGKGPAVRAVAARFQKPILVVFVGDDTTDECAFDVLPRGVTIRVGATSRTNARFHLRNPREVRQFLEKLEAELT